MSKLAKITLLGAAAQPLKEIRLIDWLETNLQNEQYSHFIFETAFARQNPFIKLSEAFSNWGQAGKTITAYMGVDHKGTSIQALQNALTYFSNVYITHARYSTFHPKTYLFYGSDFATFYSGSNNFTSGGLETNFESGLFIDLNLSDADDKTLLNQFLVNYSVLDDEFECCIALDDHVIKSLQESDCLLDETSQASKGHKKRNVGSTGKNTAIETLFGDYRALPPRALPKLGKTKKPNGSKGQKAATPVNVTGVAANSAIAANGLVMQVKQMQAKHNGEIMLSKMAVDQNPGFFGYPFSGHTTPKFARNASSPQRKPDPIVNIQIIDASGKLITNVPDYDLNTIYYTKKSEIRITVSVSIMPTIPSHTILVMTKAINNSYDYDLVFYHPGSKLYDDYLKICNQELRSGGSDSPRKFGWI